MKADTSRLKQLIRQAEESRQDHVQAILREDGPLRSGSLVKLHRKCGKPTCHCATDGTGHPTTYLSYKQDGKTRMLYVPATAEPQVTQEAQRYRQLRRHRASLAKLARQSLKLVDQLQQALLSTEPIMRDTGKGSGVTRRLPPRRNWGCHW